PFKNDGWHSGYFHAYLFSLFIFIAVFVFVRYVLKYGGVRLNRQAQVIHFALGKNDYFHVPWKNIRPFTYHELSNKLILGYPLPSEQREKFEDDSLERLYGKEPPHLTISISGTDAVTLSGNLYRLEFIRRYMELGVEGIRPIPEIEAEKITTNLRKIFAEDKTNGPFSYLLWLLEEAQYYIAGGPLIDRWVRYEARKFKWPEEVERLCTPGADLTGFD